MMNILYNQPSNFTVKSSVKNYMLLFAACLFSQYLFAQRPTPVISGITDITSSDAIAHWFPVTDAQSYIVRRYALGSEDYTYYDRPITDTLRRISNMLPATYYSVQVKAVFSGTGDSSAWSDAVSFSTLNGCAAPASLTATKITNISVRLRWVLPATPASNFDIRYRELGTSSWLKENKNGSENLININGLSASTDYEWQIRSNCDIDKSDWVKGSVFTTLAAFAANTNSSDDSKVAGKTVIKTIPNPSNGNFIVQMDLPATELLTSLALYNNFGEKVWAQNMGKISGALYKNISLVNNLPSGVYVLIVERDDARLTQKIVISK